MMGPLRVVVRDDDGNPGRGLRRELCVGPGCPAACLPAPLHPSLPDPGCIPPPYPIAPSAVYLSNTEVGSCNVRNLTQGDQHRAQLPPAAA